MQGFFEIVFYTCVPPFLLGLAVWGCRRLFLFFIGDDSGRPLMLFTSVLSTPVREAGHAIMAVIFFHRIEDMRLLSLDDPNGEFGYVEHSYNPRNPLAVLGNLFYAVGPAVTGLFAVLLVLLTCFSGVLPAFLDEVGLLGETGADFGAYALAAFSLFKELFVGGSAHVIVRILGCVLLFALCLGVHITPSEIMEAITGFFYFLVPTALFSAVLLLLDDRITRMVFGGIRTYATAVVAMFLIVLAFAAALVVIGFLFGIIRTLFNIDHITVEEE